MTLTLTSVTGDTLRPQLWHRYDTARESGNIVHRLASGNHIVTPRKPAPRTCTIRLLFPSEIAATIAELWHRDSQAGTLKISDTDLPSAQMEYVVQPGGTIRKYQEADHPGVWWLDVDAIDLTTARTVDTVAPWQVEAVNFFTNPRLVGDGTWAEVRRNRVTQPRLSASISHWQLRSTGVQDNGTTGDGRAISVTAAIPDGSYLINLLPAQAIHAPAGGSFSHGVRVRNTGSAPINLRASLYDPNIGTSMQGVSVEIPSGETRLLSQEVATLPPGYVAAQLRLTAGTGGVPVGAQFDVLDGWTAEWSPSLGDLFDGDTPDFTVDPDMRQRWLGTPNASESVMEGERVAGLTASRCVAIVSSIDGKSAVRLIPTEVSSSLNTAAVFPIPPAARTGGTLIGTLHIPEPVPTLSNDYLRLSAVSPLAHSAYFRGPGSAELRLSYPALNSNYSAVIRGGSAVVGSGDVWWTDIGLYAGDYDGPAFSGADEGVPSLERYSWEGEPDNSWSTFERRVLTTGGIG